MKSVSSDATVSLSCKPTRLAESDVAAVDRCDCGVIQLHLGALTLRFEPRAALELLATLNAAMTKHAGGSTDVSLALAGSVGRGQA